VCVGDGAVRGRGSARRPRGRSPARSPGFKPGSGPTTSRDIRHVNSRGNRAR
jgi:hypothetical protein